MHRFKARARVCRVWQVPQNLLREPFSHCSIHSFAILQTKVSFPQAYPKKAALNANHAIAKTARPTPCPLLTYYCAIFRSRRVWRFKLLAASLAESGPFFHCCTHSFATLATEIMLLKTLLKSKLNFASLSSCDANANLNPGHPRPLERSLRCRRSG